MCELPPAIPKPETWYCYILRNTDPQYHTITYNGSTNDPVRRLRQHNEIIKGGAKATRGKSQAWEIYAIMTGFPDHKNALSCEWRIKHPSGKPGAREPSYTGVSGRIRGLNRVLQLDYWTKQCVANNRDHSFVLYITKDVSPLLDRSSIPSNITILEVETITKDTFI